MFTLQRNAMFALAIFLPMAGAASAAGSGASGAVVQSGGGPVRQDVKPPPLKLSEAQRQQIAKTVASHDTDVSFALKNAKKAANFTPKIGAKIPKGLKAHPLPRALYSQMPALKEYKYLKFKDEVLIVNPMTKKIVDMFPLA
jgi:hypothetical protein